eukprot:CAMPEP_0182467344 /NCGR_PEP_ID=MMETSP1319-20130603/13687_1 /TAXON_ID=172717 /ORGANISM="Bolidomonas pacifica, Strain RCC208" /LENGTH=191 /DNA_ID=CAMNT_0024667411 /DNA_START=103 /DNA_END=675 /DNA_ORIENTATION=-
MGELRALVVSPGGTVVLNFTTTTCALLKSSTSTASKDLDTISGHYLGVVLTALDQFNPSAELLAKPSSASALPLPPSPVFEVDVGGLRVFAGPRLPPQGDPEGTSSSASDTAYLACLVCSVDDAMGEGNAERLRVAVDFLGRSFHDEHDLDRHIALERQQYEEDVQASTIHTLMDETHDLNPETKDEFIAF